MTPIDTKVSAASQYSKNVSGSKMAQMGSKGQSSIFTAQVVPDNPNGEFEVELQGAVNSIHGAVFTKFGSFDQDSETLISAFAFSMNCLYRFKHISGGSCRVLLTG